MAKHNELGKWGEDCAEEYLVRQGYSIRERDWHYGKRDVDIIAISEDMRTIVFIEVKTRMDDDITEPFEAVNRQKIKNIGLCANTYIKVNNLDMEIRFDVISIVGSIGRLEKLDHIEDAFNPCLI